MYLVESRVIRKGPNSHSTTAVKILVSVSKEDRPIYLIYRSPIDDRCAVGSGALLS